MKILFPSFLMIAASVCASTDVVYGPDNRVDVYQSPNGLYHELAKSTAAMIKDEDLKPNNDGYFEVQGYSLEERGVCPQERFSRQMSAADCTGFLVGEKLLVTAGHCVSANAQCDDHRWVFDFKVESENQYAISVPAENVYSCGRVVSRVLDTLENNDYALIELDRAVSDRDALEFRQEGSVALGDALVVIGHPSGLPSKIADGANVRELFDNFFVANLDTYGGNSGSPVFNASTGLVEGILVRGDNDYFVNRLLGCRQTNFVSDDAGRGEDVTYITNIPELK